MTTNRCALLPHRPAFPGLGAVLKDPWRTTAPAVDEAVLVAGLPPAARRSVRIDPELRLVATSEPLGRPDWDGKQLTFSHRRTLTGKVTGPPERLGLLARLLDGRAGLRRADVEQAEVPVDLPAFVVLTAERTATVRSLLHEGRKLVEVAERLVCRLYAVPDELEEAVIANALSRASSQRAPAKP